jgi:hypothetical protein
VDTQTESKLDTKAPTLLDPTDVAGRKAATNAQLLQVLVPGAIAFFGLGAVTAPLVWKRGSSRVLPFAIGVGGAVTALWSLIPVAALLSGSERKEAARISKAVAADRVSPRWSPMHS